MALFLDKVVKIFGNFDVVDAISLQFFEITFFIELDGFQAVMGLADIKIGFGEEIKTDAETEGFFQFV